MHNYTYFVYICKEIYYIALAHTIKEAGEGNANPLQNSCLKNPTEEPCWVQSTRSHRVGYNWATKQHYGGWQLLRSAGWVNKLEVQESWWYSLNAHRLVTQEELVFPIWDWRQDYARIPVWRLLGRRNSLMWERVILLVLFRRSTDWVSSTHIREANLLYWVFWFKCQSYRKTLIW